MSGGCEGYVKWAVTTNKSISVSYTSMVMGKQMLEIDPSDKRHLFYEEMKRFFYAMREIEPEDVDDESLDEFMAAADQLSNAIFRIELRRRQRERGRRRRSRG